MARDEQGLTLRELMWTLAVLALLAAGLYQMLSEQSASYQRELHDERSRRALEGATTFIQRELRRAGSGFGGCKGAIRRWDGQGKKTRATSLVALRVYNDCNLLLTPARRCPDGSGADSFSVAYADDPAVGSLRSMSLMAAMPSSAPHSALIVRSPGHFRRGDQLLLSAPEGGTCTLLRLTANPRPLGAFYELPHAASKGLNPPAELNIFPPGGYPRGSLVTRVGPMTRVRHFAVASRRPYPALVTWTQADARPPRDSGALEVVAEGIEDLQLSWACDANGNGRYEQDRAHPERDEWAYTCANDKLPRCGDTPAGRVRLTLIARPRIADPDFEAGRRPAAEDRAAGEPADDQRLSGGRGTFRRRKVSALVDLPNVAGARR